MKIHYFCTHWGNQLPFSKFCKNAVTAGYNGVEMDLPLVKRKGMKSWKHWPIMASC